MDLDGLTLEYDTQKSLYYAYQKEVQLQPSEVRVFEIEVNDIVLKGKQRKRVKARSLFCYWAVRELGMSLTELARRLGISVAGVGYSVARGEIIARENQYQLIE